MGIRHENGYSATVEGFFVVNGDRIRVAKSSHLVFCVAVPLELPPGTEGDLLVTIDGESHSRRVRLPKGMHPGQLEVPYEVTAPF